ncbi:MAG: acyloxyacyl hydrolase [Sulfitobacter sp.]
MKYFLAGLWFFISFSAASAQEWVIDLGYTDFENEQAADGIAVGVELHARPFYQNQRFSLGFAGAAEVTGEGDFFVGAGLAGVYQMNNNWFIEGSVLPGYYDASSSFNDLGSEFEIRSLLGVGYRFASGNQVSLAVSHISNAGTASINPGLNTIRIRWRREF